MAVIDGHSLRCNEQSSLPPTLPLFFSISKTHPPPISLPVSFSLSHSLTYSLPPTHFSSFFFSLTNPPTRPLPQLSAASWPSPPEAPSRPPHCVYVYIVCV